MERALTEFFQISIQRRGQSEGTQRREKQFTAMFSGGCGLVGAVGIEPTTFGLKGRCSTTELRP